METPEAGASGEPLELTRETVCGLSRLLSDAFQASLPSHSWEDSRSSCTAPPAGPRRFQDIDTGMRLQYQEWGSGQEVVVVLHDLAESAGVWAPLARRLADSGLHIIAPDMRGHGDSTRSACGNYGIDALADDVKGFMVARDLYVAPVMVIGCGLGAAVGLSLAARFPMLVSGIVLTRFALAMPAHHFAFFPGQAAAFSGWGNAKDFLTSPCLGALALPVTSAGWAVAAMVKPSRGEDAAGQLVMKMDASWLCKWEPEQSADHIAAVQCHLLVVSGALDPFFQQEDMEALCRAACTAASVHHLRLPSAGAHCAMAFVRPFSKACLNFQQRLPASRGNCSRRPECLGIRTLPAFRSVAEAERALQPRNLPSAAAIEEALEHLGGEDADECGAMDGASGYVTKLAKEPPTYFGFVG